MEKVRSEEDEGLPGEVLFGVKNDINRNYKHIWAKNREDAIHLLGWDGQVKWTTWIKECKINKTSIDDEGTIIEAHPSVKKFKGTLEDELGSIDKRLKKDDTINIIKQIVNRRRQEAGKSINKEKIADLSKHYYYRFVKSKSK